MTDIPYQGQIVRRYGEAQYNIAMEECAELIQAININNIDYLSYTDNHLLFIKQRW
jgi:hypothetical protein